MSFKRAGIIGCGTIGCGWATFLALKGLEARLYDQHSESLERAVSKVKENLKTLVELGEIDQDTAEKSLENIYVGKSMEDALDGVEFVQESIYEDYDAKKKLFAEMDKILPENVIIATSSSGLLINDLAPFSVSSSAVLKPHKTPTGYAPLFLPVRASTPESPIKTHSSGLTPSLSITR